MFYLPNIPDFVNSFEFTRGFYFTVLAGFLTFVFLLHNILFPFIRSDVSDEHSWMNKIRSIIISRQLLLSCIIVFSLILCAPILLKAKRYFHFRGEPICKFWSGYMWGSENISFYNLNQVQINKEENLARERFQASAELGNKQNVVLIVVDALRADNLHRYGYEKRTMPFLESLIDSGYAFAVENAYSTTNSTIGSIPSLFLSKSFRNISPMGFGLVEALKRKGYHISTLTSGNHSGWYSLSKTYKDYSDFFFDATSSKKFKMEDDRILLEGLKMMPDWKPGQGHFLYIHIISVHNVGVLQDKYRVNKPDLYNPLIDGQESRNEALVNNYNNRLLQADAVIGSILDHFFAKGLLESTTFIITSDHGQSLGEGGRKGHVSYLHREGIRIPLIILDKNIEIYSNKKLARLIDIAPTVLKRIQLPVPKSWEGHSLLDGLTPSISFHENGGGKLNYHCILENDSAGNIFRYLYNSESKKEELAEVIGNNEFDRMKTDSYKLELYRNLVNKHISGW